jgi:SOS-response transcriptional repressor LexA
MLATDARRVAVGMGLTNRQGIDQHLTALAAKEVIELSPKISRGIRVLRPSLPDGMDETG